MAKLIILPALALVSGALSMDLDSTDPLYPCVDTLGRQKPANCEKHKITLPLRPGGKQLISEFAIREGETRLVQAVFRLPFVDEVKLLRLKGTSYDLVGFAKRRRDGFLHYQSCHEAGTYLWEVYKAADADYDTQDDDDTDDDNEPTAWMIRASMMDSCTHNPTLNPFYISDSRQQVPRPQIPSSVSSEFKLAHSELPAPIPRVMDENGPVVPSRIPGTNQMYGSEKGITPAHGSTGSTRNKAPNRRPPATGSAGTLDTFDDMDPSGAEGALSDTSSTGNSQADEFGLPSNPPDSGSNPPDVVNARVVSLVQAEITATGSALPPLPTRSPMASMSGISGLPDNIVVINPAPEGPVPEIPASTAMDNMAPMPTQRPSLPPGMMELPDNIEVGTTPAETSTSTSMVPAASMVDVMSPAGPGAAAPSSSIPANTMPMAMPTTMPMGDASSTPTQDVLSAVDKLVQDLAGDSSEAALLKQVTADAATIVADMEKELMGATTPAAGPMPSTAYDMMPMPTTMPAEHAMFPPGIIVGTEPLAPQAVDNNPFGTAPGPVENLLPGGGLLMDMAENPPFSTMNPTTTMMAHDDMPATMPAPNPTDSMMSSSPLPVASDAPIAAAAVNLQVPSSTSEFFAPMETDSQMKDLAIPPIPVTVTDMMAPSNAPTTTIIPPVMSTETPMPMAPTDTSSSPSSIASTVTATVTEVLSETDNGPDMGNPDTEYPEEMTPIEGMTENEFLLHLMDYIKTGRLDIALVKIQSRLLFLPAVAPNVTTTESKMMADDEMVGPEEVITDVKGVNEPLIIDHEMNDAIATPVPTTTTPLVSFQPSSRAVEPVMEAKAQTGDMDGESRQKAKVVYILLGVFGAVCAAAALVGAVFGYRRYRQQRQPKYPIMRINNLPTHKVDVSVDDLWKQQQMSGVDSHGDRLARLSGTATVV